MILVNNRCLHFLFEHWFGLNLENQPIIGMTKRKDNKKTEVQKQEEALRKIEADGKARISALKKIIDSELINKTSTKL